MIIYNAGNCGLFVNKTNFINYVFLSTSLELYKNIYFLLPETLSVFRVNCPLQLQWSTTYMSVNVFKTVVVL